jgi:hypothetical protein
MGSAKGRAKGRAKGTGKVKAEAAFAWINTIEGSAQGEIKVIVALGTHDSRANWPFVRFKGIADVLRKRDCA